MYQKKIFLKDLDHVRHFVEMTTKYDRLKINLVSDIVDIYGRFANNARIKHIGALVLVPVHQVVSVNQRTDVDIRRVVAEHFGEEIAVGDGRVADDQLVRELHFNFGFRLARGFRGLSGRFRFGSGDLRVFRQRRHPGHQQDGGKHHAQDSLQLVHVDQTLSSFNVIKQYAQAIPQGMALRRVSGKISRSSRRRG